MTIRSVRTAVLRIPLARQPAFSNRRMTHRDYALVRIETSDGVEGIAYCLEGILVAAAIEELLGPLLIGEDPFDTRRLWERLYRASLQVGRRGAVMRGISLLDIAMWDIKGKTLGLPMHRLLGANALDVPAYASGGYYFDDGDLDALQAEMRDYVERGFDAVKMKIGRLDAAGDAARVRVAREAIGPGVKLMVDANNAWDCLPAAMATIRAIEPYDVFWVEEPTLPDAMALSARIAAASPIPIATGEIESTLWGFEHLVRYGAAEILQPDVTVVGGVTEFLRVADFTAAQGLAITPHYFWDLQAPLVAACPNALMAEYFVHDDVVNFDLVLAAPIEAKGGRLPLNPRPGFGLELDEQAVERFRLR